MKSNVDTLDSQIAFHGCSQVDFIKIDVEGYELQVLKGAEKTIQEFTPVIFIEIADRIRGREYVNHNYRETLQWLQNRGYVIYKCAENGMLKKVNPHSRSEHVAMYLCLHKNAHNHIRKSIVFWVFRTRILGKIEVLINRCKSILKRLLKHVVIRNRGVLLKILYPMREFRVFAKTLNKIEKMGTNND